MKQKILGILLMMALVIGTFASFGLMDDEDDIKQSILENESRQQDAENRAKNINELTQELEAELAATYAELDALMEELAELETAMNASQAEIDYYSAKQAEAEAALAEQRAAMALRIQYTYEQGDTSLWEVLLGAKSLGEIINAAEYVESMNHYDRQMLERYEAALGETTAYLALTRESRETLALQAEEMRARQQAYAEKTEQLIAQINEYQQEIVRFGEMAQAYAAQAETYRQELAAVQAAASRAAEEASRAAEEAARQASEEQAARESAEAESRAQAEAASRAAADEASRAAETATQPAETTQAPTVPATTQETATTAASGGSAYNNARGIGSVDIDPYAINPTGYTNLDLLAAIIDCEAGGQPYEGKVAVGNVIFSRILDPRFQLTLYDVIYAPWQFTPAYMGYLEICLARGAREACYAAAMDCFNGVRTIDQAYLYFCSPADWEVRKANYSHWMQLGSHIFYY